MGEVGQAEPREVEHAFAVVRDQSPPRLWPLPVRHRGQMLYEETQEEGYRDRGREYLPQEGPWAVTKLPRKGLQAGRVIRKTICTII